MLKMVLFFLNKNLNSKEIRQILGLSLYFSLSHSEEKRLRMTPLTSHHCE